MNPYKCINDSESVLKTLVNEARNSDNKVTRLKELNILIDLHNNFKELLENKYYTDYFDILILNRLYHTLIKDKEDLNVEEFLMWLDQDIRQGKHFVKDNIVDYLQWMQMYKSTKKGYIFQDDKKTWLNSIENLMKQVKEKIVFHKKYK